MAPQENQKRASGETTHDEINARACRYRGRAGAGRRRATPAAADAVADFYKGKQITMVVGYGTGGGFDVYARLVARHIVRFIPGNPTAVVQNMPGAGSLRAVNHLYNLAPKDGTVMAHFSRNMPLLAVLGNNPNARFDAHKFTWLGSSSSFANDAYILVAGPKSPIKSIEDARRPGGPPIVLGGSAEGSTSNDVPVILRDTIGLNYKLVAGYPDSAALFLATERAEVDGRMVDLSGVKTIKPHWLKPDSGYKVLVQFGRETRVAELCRRADRARARAQSVGARADRTDRAAVQAVAAVRGAARRAGRPRPRVAGGLPGHAPGSAIPRRRRQGQYRHQPGRPGSGHRRDPPDRAGAAGAVRVSQEAVRREQGLMPEHILDPSS